MPKLTCSVNGCETISHRAGRCATHYAHALASGECGNAAPCIWPDCDRLGVSRRMCQTHYARARVVKEYETPWVAWDARIVERANRRCRWPDCDASKFQGRGLCPDHYRRATIVGDMTEPWKLWKPGGHCEICGKWADGPKHGRRYCSNPCNMIGWKRENADRVRELGREHVRRRRAQMRSTQVDKFTDKDIRLSRGDDCYLCGDRINFKLKYPHPKSPTVDHVIPLSRGGSHTLENCAMTHFLCNQKKSARETDLVPAETLFAI